MTQQPQSPETILPDDLFEGLGLKGSCLLPQDILITRNDIVSLGFDNGSPGVFVLRVLNAPLTDEKISQEVIRESKDTEKYELPGCAALACMAYLSSLADRQSEIFSESDGVLKIMEELPEEQQQIIERMAGKRELQPRQIFEDFDPAKRNTLGGTGLE